MASVLKLYPYDMRKSRRPNLSRKGNSEERCGCFNVAAQNNLSLLDQYYSPNVNYSLKKKQRWKLLEQVNRNPAAIFDEDDCPEDVQIVVSKRQRAGADCVRLPDSCSHFYRKNSAGVTEVKEFSTRKFCQNINTRSMVGMINKKQGISTGSKAEITFLSTHIAVDQRTLEAEAAWTKTEARWNKSKRKSRLKNYTKSLVNEEDFCDDLYDNLDDDIYEEDEEEFEENAVPDHSEYQVSVPDISQSTQSHDFEIISETDDLCDFEVVEDSAILEFKDKVKVHRRFIYAPEIELSVDKLKAVYGNTFVTGSADSDICVIDISDILGQRILPPMTSQLRYVEAYVILEKVGDYLSVCLNCHVNPDKESEIYPPSLLGLCEEPTIEVIVEECVLKCELEYQSAFVIEDRRYLTEVSGFWIPLDANLQTEKTVIDSVLPKNECELIFKDHSREDNSQCGICLSDFQSARLSMLRGCRHAFCETCWSQHLLSQVKAGRRVLSCPEVDCEQAADFVTKIRHLSVSTLQSHHRQVTSAVMESHKDFVWCPNSTCSRPMKLLGFSERRQSSLSLPVNIWCSCNASFCPDCRQEAHWPASCDIYRAFVSDLQERGEWTTGWSLNDHIPFRIITKPCPECFTNWEKDGGCNQMTCTSCLTDFCWHCGLLDTDHHIVFPCSLHRADAIHKEMIGYEAVILPEFTSVHLRQMTNAVSISNSKNRYSRLVKRAISIAHKDVTRNDLEMKTTAFFRALRECAQISQFSKVAAMAEGNAEHRDILNACSKTFEDLSVAAFRALKDLSTVEVPKSRTEALARMSDCQTQGGKAAQELATYLATQGLKD